MIIKFKKRNVLIFDNKKYFKKVMYLCFIKRLKEMRRPIKSVIFPIFGLIILLSLIQCKSKKDAVRVAIPEAIVKNFETNLVLNYRLDKSGITDTFNNAINEIFKQNFDIPDYDIKMKLSKPQSASVEIEGNNVLVVIPVQIYVEKNTFISKLTARGNLEMTFMANVDIDSLWNVKTSTKLAFHRWIEKPKLSVLGVHLPIETIANTILNKSKTVIETSIDQSIKDNFTIKAKMRENMKMFEQPLKLDDPVDAWLYIQPSEFRINKVINQRISALGKIQVKGTTTFSTYKPEVNAANGTLPKVFWSDQIPDSSVFRVVADIKTMDINQILKNNLEGKTFTEGGKSITLSNIVTNCDYENLRVVTDAAGTVNGTLIFQGKPKYDAKTNEFYMTNIDISLKTKNIIHKAAAWIGEGKIRKELEKQLRFSVNNTLAEAQANIDQKLKDFNEKYDIDMKIGIGSAIVENFELKPGQIEAIINTKFYLEMRIKDFRSFNKL